MIKRNYTLLQTKLCSSSNSFVLYQTAPTIQHSKKQIKLQQHQQRQRQNQNDIQSQNGTLFSQGNFIPQTQIGYFQQINNNQSCCTCSHFLFCCSCQPISKTKMLLYGQQLSLATRVPSDKYCYMPFGISQNCFQITTLSKVRIGKIVRKCCSGFLSCCLNQQFFQIFDAEQKLIYIINQISCQCGFFLPSCLRCSCGKQIIYQIINPNKNQKVGTIQNIYNGFCNELFGHSKRYQISLPKQSSDKQKILLLNAVLYLNVLFYQMF